MKFKKFNKRINQIVHSSNDETSPIQAFKQGLDSFVGIKTQESKSVVSKSTHHGKNCAHNVEFKDNTKSLLKSQRAKTFIERPENLPWLIYPDDTHKANWDVFISVVLIWTCIVTPAQICFDMKDLWLEV